MKRFLPIALSMTIPLLWSCSSDRQLDLNDTDTNSQQQITRNATQNISSNGATPGILYVKLRDDAMQEIKTVNNGDISLRSVPTPLQSTFNKAKVTKMTRLFPHAGEFEERTRAEGLHRWMVVFLDETQNITEMATMFANHKEFEYVELDYEISSPEIKMAPAVSLRSEGFDPRPQTMFFNDPLLPRQWHYHNTGIISGSSRKSADVNLFRAWEIETGKPNVIVCVVDGGIDPSHEDLQGMVLYDKSINYILKGDVIVGDSIYPDIDGHGTHVAGTVAAINNNGIGVSGVAGGDGTPNSGIRLINAQIFGKKGERSIGGGALGIKFGADNGAVISQNSWGYSYPGPVSLPQKDKEAIDYFIKYAGKDKDGNQRSDSPMKGGVVIFAAGNSGAEYDSWPGAYSECISVAAMAWDFSKASYSDRGTWVSIMAPGGDITRHGNLGGVLSTVPKSISPSGYAFFEGTSMACPHVSGIAALVLSKFGGPGYTNDDLKKRILSSLRPYDINYYNPEYQDKVGVGYIDAAVALEENKGKKPTKPENISLTSDFTEVSCTWDVSADEDAILGIADHYLLYRSTNELTASNYQSTKPIVIRANGQSVGEQISYQVKWLTDNTTYYIAIQAVDRWGLKSEPVFQTVKTRYNNAPVVTEGLPTKELTLLNRSEIRFVLPVSDKDGHSWTHTTGGDMDGVRVIREEDQLTVIIRPSMSLGKHSFNITLIDELEKKTTYTINFQHLKYEAPRLVADFGNVIIGKNDSPLSISLEDKFSFIAGIDVAYTAKSDDTSIATVEIDNTNNLILKGIGAGIASITIEVKDQMNTYKYSFDVRVVENSNSPAYVIYPIPTKKYLNALLNMNLKKATFIVTNIRGEEVLKKVVTPNDNYVGRIDVRNIVPGTYNLTILTEKGNYKRTFVKL